ncbi:hypothetical protein C0992_011443 [Termitomyces sp. T32_za158]|nr:hypothetical protein C0992_011443 [Termitomyces sp. T32_za158]
MGSILQFESHLGLEHNSILTTQTPLSTSHIRLRYARIRLVDIGVLTPFASSKPTSPTPIPFILALEPLYFGVLPSSIVPVLAYIFGAFIMACMIVPPLVKYFDGTASQARKELLWDRKCD